MEMVVCDTESQMSGGAGRGRLGRDGARLHGGVGWSHVNLLLKEEITHVDVNLD